MSRIAFISDIHGNLPALRAVLSDIEAREVGQIFCLGDLVGYYCQINEVIDIIRKMGIPCLMGNHDYALAFKDGVIDRSRTCTYVLGRQLEYITEENLDFLKSNPRELDIDTEFGRIFCVHGGLNDHLDEYVSDLNDDYFKNLVPDIKYVVSAHNHCANVMTFLSIIYANCGSVGQPRDHDPRASWLLLEDGQFEIERVEYCIDETMEAMRIQGFDDYISEVLYKGFRIGEK